MVKDSNLILNENMYRHYQAVSKSLADTLEISESLANIIPVNTVIALNGDLGAGKTTFVRGLAAAVGAPVSEVSSPTFTLQHIYSTDSGRKIFHFDVYRMQDSEEFLAAGLDECFFSNGVVLIEWADIIQDILPATTWFLRIGKVADERYWDDMANFLLNSKERNSASQVLDLSNDDENERLFDLFIPASFAFNDLDKIWRHI